MKKLLFLCLWAAASIVVHAQPADNVEAARAELERTRINTERVQLESGFTLEAAACHQKFLVNNCLDEVNVRRRVALADLRRQEIYLNEQERKSRGAEQLRKTEEKASLQNQQQEADKRAVALQEFESKSARLKQKQSDRTSAPSREVLNSNAAAGRLKNNQLKANARATSRAASRQEVKKYNERQEKAIERKAKSDRERLSRTKPAALPLPVPQ